MPMSDPPAGGGAGPAARPEAPDALLGIVADRAGIDQDDVRLPGIVGVAHPSFCMIDTTISESPTFIWQP